ncbi:5966_t:CDS:2 [Ambispora leptoticha]|uniref:D-arabinono-1,4-lactone oxidase n=1 Tax=Ambispora leptoticha TaxID=144679 RepID=A0A9N8ZDH0_9GLOM|nr:5966_t:CDS:2 [Ambispora leptoticha]
MIQILHQNLENGFVSTSKKTWRNWAGTVTNNPQCIFLPNTLEELRDIVKNAKKNGKKIRCAAQGHSWSSLSATKDYFVIVNNLTKVQVQKREKYGWTIIAEAGASIKQIDDTLRNNDPPLTMNSMTVINTLRASGIVSTGAHGAKIQGASVSDELISLQIVTADGELHEFSEEKDPQEMNVARVSLGLLGIIYSVTFRVEPLFNLRMIDTFPLATDWLKPEILKQYYENSDSLEVIYWPFNQGNIDTNKDTIWVKQWIRTEDPATVSQKQITQKSKYDAPIFKYFFTSVYNLTAKYPAITPITSAILYKLVPQRSTKDAIYEAPDAIHFQSCLDIIPLNCLEFTFKVNSDFSNVHIEMLNIMSMITKSAKQGEFPLNSVAEFRINKASKAILASGYDADPNAIYCHIEIITFFGTPGWKEFSAEIANGWIEKYQARPHWGKEWEHVPGIIPYLHTRLSDQIKTFEIVRAKYDPKKIFFDNDSLNRIFYN